MWQLFQFPLCPFSRKVRLMLGEKGVAHELVRESPWLKRDEFIDMNPAGQTPVLVEDAKGTVLIDSNAIREYFEATTDRETGRPSCRESACQYVSISEVAVTSNKNNKL